MQKILSYVRRAVQEYGLIGNGDKIAVGVSGGKDSVALLTALAKLKTFIGIPFELCAITLDPRFGGEDGDYGEINALCASLEIPYTVLKTDIAEIIFDIRKESNPCSLCAKMRRGALHEAAKTLGCNKIALGHNNDDVIETFLMNLFREGRLGCFKPLTYLSRRDITVIRPLVFAPEHSVLSACRKNNLPIISSKCPADKNTERQRIKEFIEERERNDKGFKLRLFGALRKSGLDGWGIPWHDT